MSDTLRRVVTVLIFVQVLLNVTQLDQAKIFGTPEFFGISYQPDLPEDTNQVQLS